MAKNGMKLVGKRGDNLYLLSNGKQGIIVDVDDPPHRYPSQPIDSILARGYWEEVDNNQDIVDGLMLVEAGIDATD